MKKLLYVMVSVVLINAIIFTSKVFCYKTVHGKYPGDSSVCVGDDCGHGECKPEIGTVMILNNTGHKLSFHVYYTNPLVTVCTDDKTTLDDGSIFCNGTGLCHINKITVWLADDKKITTSTEKFRAIKVTYNEEKKKLNIEQMS